MRILMIATGYPPYLFSENLCNGKLAMAMLEQGIDVDVISRVDEGPTYGSEWIAPWDVLKPTANIIQYKAGNKLQQIIDYIYSGLSMGGNFTAGIRWARRAYEKAATLLNERHYDVVMTRSPNDIAHLTGLILKKRYGVKWIANWNDPAAPIWPAQYKHDYSPKKQKQMMKWTERMLRGADVNTFPSESLRQHFIENFPFLKKQNTDVLPHIGLIESAWPIGETNPEDGKIRFLHSGNLSSERNPETTFLALRQLIDEGETGFEFHIMGHVNDYTNALIKKYRLDNYVKFIGSYTYLRALEKMQAYDVLVLLEAKLDKGIFFASKFTDYLQTGLPILAISPTLGFAVDKLCGQKGEYIANNQDPNSIYATFKKILLDFRANKKIETSSSELFEEVRAQSVIYKLKSIIK